jgi:hypothetical protein
LERNVNLNTYGRQNAEHRCSAVYCIRQFIYRLPNAFVVNLPVLITTPLPSQDHHRTLGICLL